MHTRHLLPLMAGLALASCNGHALHEVNHADSVSVSADTAVSDSLNAVDSLERRMVQCGMVDLSKINGVTLDLRYATDNNFAHRNLYGTFSKAYATPETAQSLEKAVKYLKGIDSSLGIVVFDAARPQSVQRIMWNCVKGTPNARYVARPYEGGPHNFGVALDVSLTRNGVEVDMGTPFDSFSPLSHIDNEPQLLSSGKLSAQAVDDRLLLRRAMTQAGFLTYKREWWHFERHRVGYARRHLQRYRI